MRASQRFVKGVIYFPLKVNILGNERIRVLINDHGNEAFAIMVFLWCGIYGNDYYRKFSTRERKLFCSDHKLESNKLEAILLTCFEEELFDFKIYKEYEVLTSYSIQETWLDITNRRNMLEIIMEYFMIPIDTIYLSRRVRLTDLSGKVIQEARDKFQKIIVPEEPVRKAKKEKGAKKKPQKPEAESQKPSKKETVTADHIQDLDILDRAGKLFGFGGIYGANVQIMFTHFVTALHNRGQLEEFREQFTAYNEYQILTTKRYLHSAVNFIGTQASKFTDGKWLERNWKEHLAIELSKHKKNGGHNPTSKIEDLQKGHDAFVENNK